MHREYIGLPLYLGMKPVSSGGIVRGNVRHEIKQIGKSQRVPFDFHALFFAAAIRLITARALSITTFCGIPGRGSCSASSTSLGTRRRALALHAGTGRTRP